MADKSNTSVNVTIEDAQQQLFYVWCFLLVMYVALFLFSSLKTGVGFPLAIDATWKVAYMIVPVLGAFAGFWFGPGHLESEKMQQIPRKKRNNMMVLTCLLHGIVVVVIIVGVLLADFKDQEIPISYPDRIDTVLKFLLLIWSVSLVPVGWLLNGEKISAPDIPATAK